MGAPTQGNSAFHDASASQLGAPTQGNSAFHNASASQLGAPTPGNSVFEQMDDAAFNAYQSRNGIQSADEFAEQVIRNNTVQPQQGTQSIIDDLTGVNRAPASAHGAPTQGNSAFEQMDDIANVLDDGFTEPEDWIHQHEPFYHVNEVNPPPTDNVSVVANNMDDAAASTFEQTNWELYDPARPGAVGTERGYIQNGEFIEGSSFASGQEITSDTSMFEQMTNRQFKAYQNSNGINKNQLPPV
jgi:hypothetical protein